MYRQNVVSRLIHYYPSTNVVSKLIHYYPNVAFQIFEDKIIHEELGSQFHFRHRVWHKRKWRQQLSQVRYYNFSFTHLKRLEDDDFNMKSRDNF